MRTGQTYTFQTLTPELVLVGELLEEHRDSEGRPVRYRVRRKGSTPADPQVAWVHAAAVAWVDVGDLFAPPPLLPLAPSPERG